MFPGLMRKDFSTGIRNGGFERVPVVFNIIWVIQLEAFSKRNLYSLLGGRFMQAIKVQPSPYLLLLNPSIPLQFDRYGGAYKAMVCPAVISAEHDVHISLVPGSYNDIVNEMPMSRMSYIYSSGRKEYW